MYSGSDLASIQSALDTLCSDGFLSYDLNIGLIQPYLNITLSSDQVTVYPWLSYSLYQYLQSFYFSVDFTPSAADFISAFQAGVASAASSNEAAVASINTSCSNFGTFVTAYNSKA